MRALKNGLNTAFNALLIIALGFSLGACESKQAETSNAKLYFSARNIGPSVNIYAIDASKNLQKLTDDSRWRDLGFDISSSDDIVFVSNRKAEAQINLRKFQESYDLFLLPAGAPAPVKLLEADGTEIVPRFSPDDEKVAYITHGEASQALMLLKKTDNTNPKLLQAEFVHDYSWSPDGTELAVAYSDEHHSYLSLLEVSTQKLDVLVTLPLQTSDPTHAPNDDDDLLKHIIYVSWSPDGEKLAYIRNPLFPGVRQLFLIDLKQRKPERISDAKVQVQDDISWSSDGKSLLYSALVDYNFYFNEQQQKKVYEGGMHIFRYTLNGQNEQLTKGDHVYRRPTYSPDDQSIAFFYAEDFGLRTFTLKKMKVGEAPETLFDKVSPLSPLIWQ